MTYEEKIAIVERKLIEYCKEKITSRYNYCNEFFMWSYSAIKEGYVAIFEEQFGEWMNEGIKGKLWFSGQNFAFAVQTYLTLNPNYTLKSLLRFVDMFIKIQIGDFFNWGDELLDAMPNEEEGTEENPI